MISAVHACNGKESQSSPGTKYNEYTGVALIMWWNWVIPIVTLIVGLVGGFFIGAYYLRKQLEKMQSDPQMMQKMAKQMGYNLNPKQMQQAQQMMKNGGAPKKGAKPQMPPMGRGNQGKRRR